MAGHFSVKCFRFLLFVLLLLTVIFSNAFAQNRGNTRYVPPAEDNDGDNTTRAPRPTRGSALRRQRTTTEATIEQPEKENLSQAYQPPRVPITRGRTASRRVPLRQSIPTTSIDDVAPHEPEEPPPPPPPPVTEERPQNKRRRQRKRKRPQQPKVSEKEEVIDTKHGVTDDERPQNYAGNPESVDIPSNSYRGVVPDLDDKISLTGNKYDENIEEGYRRNPEVQQYFPPQEGTNRLPLDISEPVEGNRNYPDSISEAGAPERSYPEAADKPPSRSSYVPVLSPIRTSADPNHRSLPEYEEVKNTEIQDRRQSSRRKPGVLYMHSEVRLPQPEQPLSEVNKNFENQPSYDNSDETFNRFHGTRNVNSIRDTQNPTNRLPNPSEIRYGLTYDAEQNENLNSRGRSSNNVVSERQTSKQKESDIQNDKNDNSAAERRQASRYQPPLQRAGSRYGSNDGNTPTRPKVPEISHQSETNTPNRGSSRYNSENGSQRLRGSSRPQSDNPVETPSRTRNTPVPEPNRQSSRNLQRQTHSSHADITRPGSRRQVNFQENNSNRNDQTYRRDLPPPTPELEHNIPDHYAPLNDDVHNPPRYNLRPRPQFEAQNIPQPYIDEEAEKDEEESDETPLSRDNDNTRLYHQRNLAREPQASIPATRHQPPYQPQNQRGYEHDSAVNERSQQQFQALHQNVRRQQPQHESNERRQPARQNSRPQETAQANKARSSHSRYNCTESYGFYADPVQCDVYYECRNGTAIENLCQDGLAFNGIGSPKYVRCDSLRDVDCSKRPELQEPQPTRNCPRRFGLFPHESDCTKFWNCVDGTATVVQCPPGLTYNDDRATCDWADLVKTSCKTEDLLGFTCPEPNAFDLQDGVYTSYPHPDNCQLHFVCIKGDDGARRPRMLSCNEGLVYNPQASSCTRPVDVPGCENFYGVPSPPKRKPSRDEQPLPREPELEPEEPNSRRRGTGNRRTRN